jgi:hypothetical protein
VEVLFNAAPNSVSSLPSVRSLAHSKSKSYATEFSAASDTFVRVRRPARSLSAERTMTARPAIFDYQGTLFSAPAAQAFMTARLL